jgi:DNA-binding MarR family transcriptional regulator
VRVHLTDAGLKRLAERRAARAVLLEARLARLTDDERAALTAALPVLDKMLEGTG